MFAPTEGHIPDNRYDGVALPTAPVESTMEPETICNPRYTRLPGTVPARLLKWIGTCRVVVKNP